MLMALDAFFAKPEIDIVKGVYDTLCALDPRMPNSSTAAKKVQRALRAQTTHFDAGFTNMLPTLEYFDSADKQLELLSSPFDVELPTAYGGITLPLKIPTYTFPFELGSVL